MSVGSDPTSEATLSRARLVAAALVGGVVLLAAAAGALPRVDGLDGLVLPTTIAGVVSPVIGFRLYHALRERAAGAPGTAARHAAFLRATLVALAVSEAIALTGVLVAAFSDRSLPLIGVLTHVLLAGAIWPNDERLARFVEDGPRP